MRERVLTNAIQFGGVTAHRMCEDLPIIRMVQAGVVDPGERHHRLRQRARAGILVTGIKKKQFCISSTTAGVIIESPNFWTEEHISPGSSLKAMATSAQHTIPMCSCIYRFTFRELPSLQQQRPLTFTTAAFARSLTQI